ncbi:MAG: hypothetical protein LBQ79_03085 [Deltaproteobacteria bacterium]|jgi:hypothetical protein|nr:hypothetical protein [Deltaproteobacteria bacterium]
MPGTVMRRRKKVGWGGDEAGWGCDGGRDDDGSGPAGREVEVETEEAMTPGGGKADFPPGSGVGELWTSRTETDVPDAF